MNFLIHCTLANDVADNLAADTELRTGLIAGGVIGDFVKGPVNTAWPEALQNGVRLHRKIDALSNQDLAIRRLSATFPPHLRRFAPIFLDLLADHALAKDWSQHYDFARREFSQGCYAAIDEYAPYMPAGGMKFLTYMREQDLLGNYHEWDHIHRATQSVLRRLKRLELTSAAESAMQATLPATADELQGLLERLRQGSGEVVS